MEKGIEMTPQKVLRFAPLIRVSTEKQEKRGESLNTQRKQLEAAIQSLGGKVFQWYAGQEHATVNQEGKILDRLIRDAQDKKFDAVMVVDVSRWSRDNHKSKEYLKILKAHGIRFFLGTKEMNLFNPQDNLIVGMSTEIAEFFGREQAFKSMLGKIEKAKQGKFPACKLPHGRKFDKETAQWSIDPEVKKQVEEMARLYLGGSNFTAVAKRIGIPWGATVHKILMTAGNSYTVHFNSPVNGIREDVEIPIPPLLPESVMKRIEQKAKYHRNWDRTPPKYFHLFSKIIYDADSGRTMTGALIGRESYRYYRLTRRPYGRDDVKTFYSIRADAIEQAVLTELFAVLGSSESLRQAVHEGNPMAKVAKKLEEEKADLDRQLAQVVRKMDSFKRAIGDYQGDDLGAFLQSIKPEIKIQENRHREPTLKIQAIDSQLKSLPTDDEIEEKRKSVREDLKAQLAKYQKQRSWEEGIVFHHLPFPEKKKLVNLLFAGWDERGRKYGIYIKRSGAKGKVQDIHFEAYGRLGTLKGWTGNEPIYEESELDGGRIAGEVADTIGNSIVTKKPFYGRRLNAKQRQFP